MRGHVIKEEEGADVEVEYERGGVMCTPLPETKKLHKLNCHVIDCHCASIKDTAHEPA